MKSKSEPAPCPACNDMGWQRADVPVMHELFGKLLRCEVCGHKARADWLRDICRLSPDMMTWHLDGFKDRARLGAVVPTLRAIAAAGQGWATLSGPPGTGKTYLLAAVANEAREMELPAIYITTAELLSDLRDTFGPGGRGFSSLFNSVMGARVLCLDEVEKFRATAWAEEQFFRLVEQRYRNWDRGITLIATNRKVGIGVQLLDETRYPGYLESRIMDGRFAQLCQFWDVSDARPALEVGR